MVIYNPKDWLKLIFKLHKSDTLRILFPSMLLLGLITAGVCYIEKKYIHTQIPSLTIFHQIAGFIISLVLVFRINTAYDRWWEGRKLWGSLLNNSRNLAIKLHGLVPEKDINSRKEIYALISNFAFSLKEHLRGNVEEKNIIFCSEMSKEEYLKANHKPNFIARQLNSLILKQYKKEDLRGDYIRASQNINEFTDISGACERIRSTPIPYSYSLFIKKIIFIYIITMPLTFGLTVGFWSVLLVMIMFYAFASLELISEEIEDPFGTDANDLPTDEIAAKIRANVEEILLGHGHTQI